MAPTTALARPATNPTDPSKPITIDRSHIYPDTPDAPALADFPVGGGVVPFAAGTRRYVSTRDSTGGTNGFTRVRIKPGDLVEGSAITNTAFDDQTHSGSWYGGYVYYQLGGCGWILGSSLGSAQGTGGTGCPSPSRNRTDVGTSWNANANCTLTEDGQTQCDGSGTTVTCDPVPEYTNIRPWSSSAAPQGPAIRQVSNPGHNYTMFWRYKATGGQYVMARDIYVDSRDGNWVFVPTTCFSSFPNAVPMTN